MQENRPEFSGLLWDILDKTKVTSNDDEESLTVDLNQLINPKEKSGIVFSLLANLPKNNFEKVLEFHDKFKVQKEKTHIVTDFEYAELRFNLILEELLELGKALGFDSHKLYMLMITQYNKIKEKPVETSIKEVADALSDIQYVTYGAFDVFNLKPIQHKLISEVHRSNMSKLVPIDDYYLDVISDSVANYKAQGIEVISEDLKNGFIAIKHKETGKILKPITYHKPDLELIINTLE